MIRVSDHFDIDWTEAAGRLAESARTDADWYRSVVAVLVGPDDRVAVDVGCGGGGMAVVLAAALGTGGRAIGVDGSADVLAGARALAGGSDLAGGTCEFVLADLHHGMAPLRDVVPDGADVVWASASVHHLGDQQAAVTELAGLLRPGGRLALAEGGLTARHLPHDVGVGEPGLEGRLDAANEVWFNGMRARLPGSVRMPYGWGEALRRAGLSRVTRRSWLLEPEPDVAAIADRFGHRYPRLHEMSLISDADAAAWRALLDPAAPEWLGNRNDLGHVEARTVHWGYRAGS
jgi:SAM-dependent methyltransferase